MARRRAHALRKVLGFAPAITAGLALAAAVELVAGTAWRPARPELATAAEPPRPAPRTQPSGKPLPPGLLAPASVYEWSPGRDT